MSAYQVSGTTGDGGTVSGSIDFDAFTLLTVTDPAPIYLRGMPNDVVGAIVIDQTFIVDQGFVPNDQYRPANLSISYDLTNNTFSGTVFWATECGNLTPLISECTGGFEDSISGSLIPEPIPIPSSLVLLLTGLVMMRRLLWRRA